MSTTITRARHRQPSTRELTAARALLDDQRRRQLADIVSLCHDVPTSLAERDEASRRGDLHVAACLVDAARRQLDETEAALARLDRGTYGRCVQCEEQIATQRLEVLPAARYCVGCQAVKATARQP